MNTEKTESTELVQVLQEFVLAEEKKNIVRGLLLPFFAKAQEWKDQVETIIITDPSQTDKMALAKTGRLQLRRFRLDAEDLIKAQRQTIKARMADDVLEDKLWLRSGQIMEAVFKNLESKLEEKEKFAERHKAEMEEKTRAERAGLLAEYGQVEIPGLGQMSQEQFDMYLSGVKVKFEADQKAEQERQEAERVQNIHNERYARLAKYADFIPDFENLNFGKISEEDFIKVGTDAKTKKDKADAEQARIQAENERLQKERDDAERKAKEEADKAEKARKEAEDKAREESDKIKADADAKLKSEQAEKQKAIDEANRLKEAEQARIDAQNKIEADKQAEAERIAKQGENERLLAWIESFELPEIPGGGYTTSGRTTMGVVQQKFESFKAWAKTQVVSK